MTCSHGVSWYACSKMCPQPVVCPTCHVTMPGPGILTHNPDGSHGWDPYRPERVSLWRRLLGMVGR